MCLKLLESIAAMVRIPQTETEIKQNQKIRIAGTRKLDMKDDSSSSTR